MAVKWLTVAEMNQISAPMVEPGNAKREALAKVPALAALLPQLEQAHTGIMAVARPPSDPRLRELMAREETLDGEHDALVRGIHDSLTAVASVSASSPELLRLRDTLLPEGLSHVRKTYRGQAGHAAIVEAHLDDATKARLKAVNLHDKNLLDLTLGWLSVAKELGAAEEERGRVEPKPSSAAELNKARVGWIRLMNALLANAELAGIDEATDRLLFGALHAAERAADSRGRGKGTVAVEPAAVGAEAAATTPAAP